MAEVQKRFPRWLLACAAVLVIVAAVLGLIETVGRQRTIVGRYERVQVEMPESEARAILGRPADVEEASGSDTDYAWSGWKEGPGQLVIFWADDQPERRVKWALYDVKGGYGAWYLCRWAEKAWTTIHGPRR